MIAGFFPSVLPSLRTYFLSNFYRVIDDDNCDDDDDHHHHDHDHDVKLNDVSTHGGHLCQYGILTLIDIGTAK